MRPNGIVVPPPFLDHNPCLGPTPESFHRQALVSKFAIKTLVQTVLPWLTRFNQRQLQRFPGCPFEQRLRHELRTVVRAKTQRGSAFADQARQHLDNPTRPAAACNVYSQTLPRMFIHHGQAFDLLTICIGVVDKVVSPQFVCTHWQLWSRTGRRNPLPRPFSGHLQSSLGPQVGTPCRHP